MRFQEIGVIGPGKRHSFYFILFKGLRHESDIQLYAGLAGLLGLRLLLAREFRESGVMKFSGDNWFMDIQDAFPFPFNWVPADISWFLATWSELPGAIALVGGLGTRSFSASLITLTLVAWASVQAGNGSTSATTVTSWR